MFQNRKKQSVVFVAPQVVPWHALSVDEVFKRVASDQSAGLSSGEVKIRAEKYGKNELSDKQSEGPLVVFFRQFKSVLVYILLLAAVISYIYDHYIDVYVIGFVLVLNACIGFMQEYRAEQAVRALKKTIVQKAKVIRSGERMEIDSRDLVLGDIVLLSDGDRVPADIRLFEAKDVRAVESSLTGESEATTKEVFVSKESDALGDRKGMVFMGTFVVSGKAKGIVVAIGNETAVGEIATALGSIKRTKSHFSEKADLLALQMGGIALCTTLVVFLVGYLYRGFPFEDIFLFTIASLVSGIPEGLPAIFAVVLAAGAHRMSKKRALVRSLPMTETVGVADVIITDKTGTLTENVMMVERIILSNGDVVSVTGTGYEPSGTFEMNKMPIAPLEHFLLKKILHAVGSAPAAELIKEANGHRVRGEPTEGALVVLSEKAGISRAVAEAEDVIVDDVPFQSERLYRAAIIEHPKAGGHEPERELYIVGAPEQVLTLCNRTHDGSAYVLLNHAKREEILSGIESMTKDALRVVGVAYKTISRDKHTFDENLAEGMVFAGAIGMRDPVRKDATESVMRAQQAGVRVIMATGDHKGTAFAVGREIGLFKEGQGISTVYTESELRSLSEEEFRSVVRTCPVFARLSPGMKLRIAETLQEDGHIVAMTGDGVNDAPALKRADVGFAMGKTGTDVAREAAGIVLADDNFATIVSAIEEGRRVFENTKKSSTFLITTSFAEHVTILTTLVLGFPLPLLATQILWLNLVTATPSGVPLALEPSHGFLMKRRPRKASENILSEDIFAMLLIVVVVMASATVFVFALLLPYGVDVARTGAFIVMSSTQLFNILNMRSSRLSIFQIGLFSNRAIVWAVGAVMSLQVIIFTIPAMRSIFHFAALSFANWVFIIIISSSVLWFGELYKLVRYKAYNENRLVEVV